MEFNGSINFEKSITINGKPHGIEHLTSLPDFTPDDKGRIIHNETDNRLYLGTETSFMPVDSLADNLSQQLQNDYYSKTDIDSFFLPTLNNSKKQISWQNIPDKPTYFNPGTHNNDSHSEIYYTENKINTSILDSSRAAAANEVVITKIVSGAKALTSTTPASIVGRVANTTSSLSTSSVIIGKTAATEGTAATEFTLASIIGHIPTSDPGIISGMASIWLTQA
jgi:hypothetical protein